MKTLKELYAEKDAAAAEYEKTKAAYNTACKNAVKLDAVKLDAVKLDAVKNEIDSKKAAMNTANTMECCFIHNIRVVIATAAAAAIAAALEKYAGKPTGPKTRAKFAADVAADVKEKTGADILPCVVDYNRISIAIKSRAGFINYNYINFYFNIENRIIDANSKFTPAPVNAGAAGKYIENPAATAAALQAMQEKIQELKNAYNNAVKDYNTLTVGGVGGYKSIIY